MSLRHEDLSPEELAHQRALDRSWANAERALADPEFSAFLRAQIERVNASTSSRTLSKREFLASTEHLIE